MKRLLLVLAILLVLPAPSWATTWLVRQTVGSDSNGGTSRTVYQQGTDGATTNATRNFTSATANFTTGCNGGSCVNQGIFISNYRAASSWCQITTVTDATHVVLAATGGCASADNASHSSATWVVGGSWATVSKPVTTTTPITDGDNVYIGAGIYRQQVTVTAGFGTAAAVSYIGDVDGVQTGDAGIVDVNGATNGDVAIVGSTAAVFHLNGHGFMTFKYLYLHDSLNNPIILATTATSPNITIDHCTTGSGARLLDITVPGQTAANLTITNNAIAGFWGAVAQIRVTGTLTNTGAADYDLNITISNNWFAGGTNGVQIITFNTTGAGSFKPGGGKIYNNTLITSGNGAQINTGASWSTTIPVLVYNNAFGPTGGTAINAGASGTITEDYNLLLPNTTRTNVTAGRHSYAVATTNNNWMLEDLKPAVLGARVRLAQSEPGAYSPLLGFGNQSVSITTDLLGLPRPTGTMLFGESGTATSGAATTLTNTNATFPVNKYQYWEVKITGGTGSGQVKQINSNTATALTVSGNWKTNPDNTSTYVVYQGARASTGTCTAGATTTCTDSNAAWATNQWAGYNFRTDAGTGSGQTATIASNTATVLTFNETLTALDATTTYAIFRGTDENTPAAAVGAFERGNTCFQSTVVSHTGTYALRCFGPATQDFTVPVDSGVSTTVAIWTQWDSAYAGTKPQLQVLNGTEAGVTDATATAVGSSGSWEQLSLTFTPTSRGLVTVRFQSNSTATVGSAYFDDWSEFPPPAANADEYTRRGEPPTHTIVPTILRARPIQ